MSRSKARRRERERLRRQAEAALAGVPTKFVLEAMARRLDVSDGRFEVHLRDGFLLHLRTTRKLVPADLEVPVEWAVLAGAGVEKDEAAPAGTMGC